MDCLTLYTEGVAKLTAHGIPDPELDSSLFLAIILGVSRSVILLNTPVCNDEDVQCFNRYIERRCAKEPFAYIVGYQEFWSLDFIVTPDVLIPRPETELIIEQMQTILNPVTFKGSILDCGTGSGILPVTLATIYPNAAFTALDISQEALEIAHKNSIVHQVEHAISFMHADFMHPLEFDSLFDVIVSNPPYVASASFKTLQDDVVQFEPHLALDGKGDGFDIVHHLLHTLGQHLKSGGHLFMEIGYDQKEMAEDVLRSLPFYGQYTVINDYTGLPRMVHAVKVS